MLEWLVLADDRTGALEVAGAIAPWLGPVTVTVGAAPPDSEVAVVDIGSRHGAPAAAAARAACAGTTPARRRVHKIDSTLRGNWAHELVAVHHASGDRVLVVPAFPRLGRVCCGGVIHVDGEPLAGADARHTVSSPRAAAHLTDVGADDVAELADIDALRAWLAGDGPFAVCDAVSDGDLSAIGAVWRSAGGVRFAGTSGSIAAALEATIGTPIGAANGVPLERPAVMVDGHVLVVCGSLHPVARAQLDALHADHRTLARVTVLATPQPDERSVAAPDAERVAAELGASARALLAEQGFDVLVVIGGDTAAAVLGDEPVVVGGTLAPGVPWSRRGDGSGPLMVTKAGGFGNASTLVELLTTPSRNEVHQ